MTVYNTDEMTPRDMVDAVAALQERIGAVSPELVEETVTDDGETYEALRCPVCGLLVTDAGDLYGVDVSERWSAAEPNVDGRQLEMSRGEDDYGSTLYYLHTDAVQDPHPVALPAGWRESWV